MEMHSGQKWGQATQFPNSIFRKRAIAIRRAIGNCVACPAFPGVTAIGLDHVFYAAELGKGHYMNAVGNRIFFCSAMDLI